MEATRKIELLKKVLRIIDTNFDDIVEKELLDLFGAIVSANTEADKPPPHLSPTSLHFLERNLRSSPSLVHWVIDQLLCIWSTSFADSDSSLLDIYQNTLKDILKDASISSVTESERASHAIKNTNFVDEKNLSLLLFILSKLNLTNERNNDLRQWLNPMLLKSCTFEDVQLAFYSRKDPHYYKTWHKFLDDIFARRKLPENLEDSLKITYSIFEQDGVLRPSTTELFLRTIKNRCHFIDDILNICFTLIINNRLDMVSRILQNKLFKNLPLLTLLKYLDDAPEICLDKLQFLLENSNLKDLQVLSTMEDMLNHQLIVLSWIFKNSTGKSLKNLLNQLRTSSTLSVLKSSVNLDEKNSEIFALLEDCENSKTTFRAYLVMLNAIKGILMCEDYNSNFEKVSDCFSDMEKYLNSLKPLETRLEIIENIFSMLFMRYEDFSETDDVDDDERRELTGDRSGFVCNKFSIRETVHYLNRSVFAIENDLLSLRKEWIDGVEEIDRRLVMMRRYLSEATWRLELLTSLDFTKRQGLPEVAERMVNVANQQRVESNFYRADGSTDDSDSRSDVDVSSESGSIVNSANPGRKRRRRLHVCLGDGSGRKECTMEDMLATMDTLVLRCLWKGDYTEAQRVIEKLGMENSHLAGEILFSRAIKSFRNDVGKQKTVDTEITSRSKSKHSAIDIIRQAVKDGLHASRTTSQLETFLASQESNILLLSNNSTNIKCLMTLTALDLTLTSSHDYSTSENLTEVTEKHFDSTEKLKSTRYYDLFQTIHQLLRENKPESSVIRIIQDARLPLSLKEYKRRLEYWSELEASLIPLKNKTKFIDQLQDDDNNLKNELDNLLTICNNGDPYLHNMVAHLKILSTLSPESEESLLKNSLDFYIGYQIFHKNADLQFLEKIAEDLQINLVHSIIINCCPKLLHFGPVDAGKITRRWGVIVLNIDQSLETASDVSLDPNHCVIQILSELLAGIRKITVSSSLKRWELLELSKNDSIRSILNKTKNLSFVDLSHLSFGNHTLSFFLNLWNLLFLHAAIDIWSSDPPVKDLRHLISLRTIGYDVGDLGFVSISSLRLKLLGLVPSDHGFFDTRVEELNEPAWQDLDLQQDPRSIFAMVNEYENSPSINIYHLDTLSDDLNVAVHQYLDFYKNSEDKPQIALPEIFRSVSQFLMDNFFMQEESIQFESLSYAYEIQLYYRRTESRIEKSILAGNDWKTRELSSTLLQYLEGHCWLLCYLVQRIHEEKAGENSESSSNPRTRVLEKLLNSESTNRIKILYDNNKVLAGLQNNLPIPHLWEYLESLLIEKNFEKSLELINNLPDALILKHVELQRLRDKNLCEIIRNLDVNDPKIIGNLYQIRNEQILAQLILSKVKVWPVRICEEALRHVLSCSNVKLPDHCKSELNEILCRVMVFYKMLPYFENQVEETELNWSNVVYRTEKPDPIKIVRSLIDAQQFELCLEWLEYQTASSDIHSLVSRDLFLGLLNDTSDFKQARKLLSALPVGQSEKLCRGVIGKLQSIESLKFIVCYLLENSSENEKYRRASIGVELLENLDPKERVTYIHLITEPLLLLEQLLMNCKFDDLKKIQTTSSEKLRSSGFTIEKFDKIVRFYARKSLDLRVANQRELVECSRSRDSSTLRDFVMPINPPTRDEWIPNDKARECSCCRNVIFSMFNRRHHCRRCGRVVCGACSNQRMRVTGYAESVPVRVCNDCKKQSSQLQSQPSTTNSESFDCWKLTNDETHNKTVREEFCFEYAPNISLCLAILNLHSDHEAYANFLYDRCDEMKRLLYPDNKGQINREIDHKLIIKMIKSLLIAAKVKCAKLGLNTGLAHCDRFLSQIDLIDTLVKSDCLSLLPRDDLNEHTFRRLRDLLTEKEQWILALDVSTKSGLDTQGVWAAWGKACLKVGYYDRARDKFLHCLEKVNQEDFDDWVMLPSPSPKSTRSDAKLTKNRPPKDPPLVTEILQILEGSNSTEQYSKNQVAKHSSAQEIINTLGNLKNLSHGQYAIPRLSSNTKNIRYQESLYYLLMYGSLNSILEFFIRHNELDKCLSYAMENDIDQEIFFNVIVIGCLKSGNFSKLCEVMKQKDPSLLIWRKYLIATCLCLERKHLMNTLYQVQLFMKDYVRAAMTCIKFYITDAMNYMDLCMRTNYLMDAQRHLESELGLENFGKKRRKSVSSNFSGQSGSLTMEMEPSEIDKHINTISRQMEIAKFLGNCEKEGRDVGDYLSKLSFMESEGLQPRSVPTLFGNQKERTHLSVLAILCGRDVEEGFGFAFRVMQDYHLSPQKVYSLVGHILALDRRISSIEQLIKCCRSSGAPNSNAISDRVLAHCVKLLLDKSKTEVTNPREQIDCLIRIISDVELKIDSYIESKQLKAAYLLAVKHSRSQDIRKILREADRLGQSAIKSICTKWLQQARK